MPLKYQLRDAKAPLAGLEVTQLDMIRLHTGVEKGTGIKVLD